MNNNLPKQFLLLNNTPVLFHVFNSFLFLNNIEFTLVVSEQYVDYWGKLCLEYEFNIPHKIVVGGSTRFHSVQNGLKKIPNNSLVLIHDGVRPLVSQKTILNVYKLAAEKGNAIPAIGINESVRSVGSYGSKVLNRNDLRIIQTPQAFSSTLIKNAYKQSYNVHFTDDASVIESFGEKVNITDGNIENIKITTSFDLAKCSNVVNYIMKQ